MSLQGLRLTGRRWEGEQMQAGRMRGQSIHPDSQRLPCLQGPELLSIPLRVLCHRASARLSPHFHSNFSSKLL